MVHVFKGQVKVEDVQNEFTFLVDSINELIKKYNLALESLNIKIDKGANTLSPEGYSLSVGGLKSVINAYNGYVLGCKVFRIDGSYFCTAGIKFKDGHVIKLPQGQITGDTSKKFVKYNTSTGLYTFSSNNTEDETTIFVKGVNNLRDNCYLDTSNEFNAIHSSLKIFTANNGVAETTMQAIDTNAEQFICGHNGNDANSKAWWHQYLYFLGVEIEHDDRDNHKRGKFYFAWNRLFKPKGIPNPFTWTNTHGGRQGTKVSGVIKRT